MRPILSGKTSCSIREGPLRNVTAERLLQGKCTPGTGTECFHVLSSHSVPFVYLYAVRHVSTSPWCWCLNPMSISTRDYTTNLRRLAHIIYLPRDSHYLIGRRPALSPPPTVLSEAHLEFPFCARRQHFSRPTAIVDIEAPNDTVRHLLTNPSPLDNRCIRRHHV